MSHVSTVKTRTFMQCVAIHILLCSVLTDCIYRRALQQVKTVCTGDHEQIGVSTARLSYRPHLESHANV